MTLRMVRTLAIGILACGLLPVTASAGTTHVAVAANFADAAKEIAKAFKAKTGHDAVLSFGASGQFFTQIEEGAPFQVFLSADDGRPRKLVDDGFGVRSSLFTYAIGKLVLWSRDPQTVASEDSLRANRFSKLAIANPNAAPYGAAALEVLQALKLTEAVKPKIVMGNSIAQAFQFIDTGNAELGFVALSQVPSSVGGSRWLVPQNLYPEIRQDAVLLKSGADDEASRAFVGFLKDTEARAVVEKYGYGLDERSGS